MEKIYSGWSEWELTEKIGEGSFGKVYRARRIEGSRQFYSAIKIITISGSDGELADVGMCGQDEQSVRSYLKGIADDCIGEIEMMDCLKGNSNIVAVDDFKLVEHTQDPGWDIYIRMELLESFVAYTKRRTITEQEVISLGIDICNALELCERQKIIHRDIKPANIFVSPSGSFKLGDFGIARKLERANTAMSHKGTYSYMAPEIFYGERHYDSTIDTYSLGLVLYLLLNRNKAPFLDPEKPDVTYLEKDEAVRRRMQGEKLPKPCQASQPMAEIILKACSYNPRARYQSASQMKADLEKIQRGILPDMTEDATQSWTSLEEQEEKTVAWKESGFPGDAGGERWEQQRPQKKKSGLPTGVLLGVGAIAVIVAGFLCAQIFLGSSSGEDLSSQDVQREADAGSQDGEESSDSSQEEDITVTPLPTPENTPTEIPTPTATSVPASGETVSYETYYVVNCRESITLRTSPSTSASEICQIPLGAAVSYVGTSSNGFYEIIYNGNQGYALASYLSSAPQSAVQRNAVNYETYYVVNCRESITLRTSPSTSASEICQIPLGAAVSYVSTSSNGFYEIIYNGNQGYALASYLSTSPGDVGTGAISPGSVGTVVNCRESITLRTSPSTSASEICQIPLGAAVSFEGSASNGFYEVSYNGSRGYALASYLEF